VVTPAMLMVIVVPMMVVHRLFGLLFQHNQVGVRVSILDFSRFGRGTLVLSGLSFANQLLQAELQVLKVGFGLLRVVARQLAVPAGPKRVLGRQTRASEKYLLNKLNKFSLFCIC